MANRHRIRACLLRTCLVAVVAAVATAAVPTARSIPAPSGTHRQLPSVQARGEIHQWTIRYFANGGHPRLAYVVIPSWYGPQDHPPLPLVISPHGVGSGPFNASVKRWGNLAARGPFAVVFPEGQGRELAHHSWGYRGQIDDLARMPSIVRNALPWLRVDRKRIYAVGGSMGGQESLLLVARYPRLLAGAVAYDAPVDMALRYEQFAVLADGQERRALMQLEFGALPQEDPRVYSERSPLAFAPAIAASGVPVQIWWSTRDRMVIEQSRHSGRLYRELRALNPHGRFAKVVGTWEHGASMRWNTRLPEALGFLGLLPLRP